MRESLCARAEKLRKYRKSCERMNLLWKDFFMDPYLWYDNRSSKFTARSPDFRHRVTNTSLWIDGLDTPFWVPTELTWRQDIGNIRIENDFAFLELLKSCAKKKDLHAGTKLHGDILKSGLLEKNPYIANTLITMYVKCGVPEKAQQVLQQLMIQNIVSWNALISGYVHKGQGHEAIECFGNMQKKGIYPNGLTFTCILKACGSVGAIDKGKQIHEEIVNRGLLERNVMLGNALVDMYAKCGSFAKAQQMFEELPVRNVVSWNTLISGYVQHEQGHEALHCFACMQNEGFVPDEVTFTCILKACGSIGAIDKGTKIHDEIVSNGLAMENVMLGNALIGMYAKFGLLVKAREVLEQLPVHDIVSWNALIVGYVQGQLNEALNCFASIRREGLCPNEFTFTCILNACGSIQAIDKGKQVHNEIFYGGFLDENIVLGNALIDMYAKCGKISMAFQVLEELPVRNVVSWNTLISVYSQHNRGHEAFNCFIQMQGEGLSANEVTFASLLHACGTIGAIEKGRQIHDEIVSGDLLKKNIVLGTALVDMYAKCGMVEKAHEMLEELSFRDIVCWSALISGHAQEGQGHEALMCFTQMQNEGVVPDEVTFLCILNACSHSGHLNEAETYYENMSKKYAIIPKIEHHTCMVIIFGCAGCFDKAISIMKTMTCFNDPSVWLALLGACRKWKNVELGRFAFDHTIWLDENITAAYTLMASIYADVGMHKEAKMVEAIESK